MGSGRVQRCRNAQGMRYGLAIHHQPARCAIAIQIDIINPILKFHPFNLFHMAGGNDVDAVKVDRNAERNNPVHDRRGRKGLRAVELGGVRDLGHGALHGVERL